MPKVVTAYACKYCGKLLQSYGRCVHHEEGCKVNPSNKRCCNCKYVDYKYNEHLKRNSFYCNILQASRRNCDAARCDRYEKKDNFS